MNHQHFSAVLVKVEACGKCETAGCTDTAEYGWLLPEGGRIGRCYCAEHAPKSEKAIADAPDKTAGCGFCAHS